jgi:membrane dipeptidase
MDRRLFLSLCAAGSVLPSISSARAGEAGAPGSGGPAPDTKGQGRHWPGLRRSVVINTLGGITNPNIRLGKRLAATDKAKALFTNVGTDLIDARAISDAQKSGLTATNLTLGYVAGEGDPFERTVGEIASWDALIRAHEQNFLKVLTTQDILTAKREGKVGIIYGFQNSAMMGDNAARVDIFANLGVRIIQLTYNPRNQVGDGSMAPENAGLTSFGREVVARLNDQKVLVDLSHSGEHTCLDAIAASRVPIIISHTGCRALADLPRNKTDAELRQLAQRGGVAGIYFMPYLKVGTQPTAEDVVLHIEHAVDVCGEDHVAIGTDGSVTQIDDMETYRGALKEEVETRRKTGVGATGETATSYPFILDLRGVDQFQHLADLLYARGHSSGRIEKILGQNFLRLAREIWGA